MGLHNKDDSKTDQLSKKNFQFLQKNDAKRYYNARLTSSCASFIPLLETYLFVSVYIDVLGVTNYVL